MIDLNFLSVLTENLKMKNSLSVLTGSKKEQKSHFKLKMTLL
ncbi:hypothetical protein [Lactococcus hircilactis]|nr:hypothetical protein [Lactococcus hircilactis]